MTNIPYWEKYMLTLREAAEYFHIGEKKLRQIVEEYGCRLFIDQRKPNYDKEKTIRGIFRFFVCYLKFCNSKLSPGML